VPVLHEDKDRKVIPRWRVFLATLASGENAASAVSLKALEISPDALDERRNDWEKNQTFSFAADLVSLGVALGEASQVRDAAEFLLKAPDSYPQNVKRLAQHVLGVNDRGQLGVEDIDPHEFKKFAAHEIHRIRALLRDEARNAFLWSDLSFLYASLGLPDQATRAIEISMELACENRFILRSASRLFVHLDEYRRAHQILWKAERTKHDPWLLAAEIAVASTAGKTSRLTKSAKQILAAKKFLPFHTSELASALSTIEFEAGNLKFGRRYLGQSLLQPTENAIAQAAWIDRQFFGVRLPDFQPVWPASHEANAWGLVQKANWKKTIIECLKWLGFQPFSSRPATLGSYIAAVALAAYRESAEIAKLGLIANPNDFTLINNYVFALANLNEVPQAREAFCHIQQPGLSPEERFAWLATTGFLCYREGNIEEGRRYYQEAFKLGNTATDEKRVASAFLWFALEELRSGTEDAPRYKHEALARAAKLSFPDVIPLINRVRGA